MPDYEYGYGDALADGRVVRPVYFPRTNGQMEWSAPDGSMHAATFDDPLGAARASQRLRTALSLDGEWLPSVLRAANARLTEVRGEQADAGGLVIARTRNTREASRRSCERASARPQGSRPRTTPGPRRSSRLRASATRGSSRCGWSRRASTFRGCASASTRRRHRPSRSSARRSGRLVRWTRGSPISGPGCSFRTTQAAATGGRVAEQRRHSLRRTDNEAVIEPG